MQVRLRFQRGTTVRHKRGKGRRLALALSSLLTPAALMTLALAIWRIGADMGWTGNFAIASGFFSHWQVWLGMSVALFVSASSLNRYGQRKKNRPATPDDSSFYEPASSQK